MCRLQYTICTLLKKGLRPFFFVLTVAFQSTCMLWHATCDAALPRALSWCRWGWALEARREPVAHGMRIRPNPVQESSGRACWNFCLFFVPEKRPPPPLRNARNLRGRTKTRMVGRTACAAAIRTACCHRSDARDQGCHCGSCRSTAVQRADAGAVPGCHHRLRRVGRPFAHGDGCAPGRGHGLPFDRLRSGRET